jgi:hypothetical protein
VIASSLVGVALCLSGSIAGAQSQPAVPASDVVTRSITAIGYQVGSDRYAPDTFAKAQGSLQMAENALAQKAGKDQIISTSLQTEQFAEHARALAVDRPCQQHCV